MVSDLVQWKNTLSLLTVPVYFLVAFAFYRRGLWRSYLFFWICLIAEGIALALTLLASGSAATIIRIYTIAQPAICILYVLMVIEVFQKVFAKYPGIARFAQRIVVLSMAVAFAFALASIGGDLSTGWSGMSVVSRYTIILRAISMALSAFMILIAVFLIWMPIPLPPNTIRHSFLYFFYFFITTGVYYALNSADAGFVHVANLLTSVLTLGTLAAWFLLVQPAGEAIPSPPRAPRIAASDMLGRLEALNRTLARPPN